MLQPAIILGLGPSGLFLTRQLAKTQSTIYGIARYDDVGIFSKHIAKDKRFYADDAESVLRVLHIIAEQTGTRPLIYVCSDQYLTLILTIRKEVSAVADLWGASFDTLALINDKAKLDTYCKESGIKIPGTYSYVDFLKLEKKRFPVILKWTEKELNTRKNPVGKVRVCRNEFEFNEADAEVRSAGLEEKLFVQDYISGTNAAQYSVGGVFKDGSPLAAVCVWQPRQYPQGISARVVSEESPIADRLQDLSFAFATKLGFSGFLEMEYKIDTATDDIFLLDINPRPWGWVSHLAGAFPNFYKVLLGQSPEMGPLPTIWTSPLRNLLSFRNKQNATMVLNEDIVYRRAYDIRDSKDKAPSRHIYLMALKKILKH